MRVYLRNPEENYEIISSFLNDRSQNRDFTSKKIQDLIFPLLSTRSKAFLFETPVLFKGEISKNNLQELSVSITERNYEKIAKILDKIFLNKKNEQSINELGHTVRFAQMIKKDGKEGKTTNPIVFLSEKGALSEHVPKDGHIAGVFKSKFGKDIKGEDLKMIFQCLKENSDGKINDNELSLKIDKIVNYKTHIPGEKEKAIKDLKQAYKGDIECAYQTALSLWEKSLNQLQVTASVSQELVEMKANTLKEMKQKAVVDKAFRPVENRYIETAILATKYDAACGTHLFPAAQKQNLQGKGLGFIQKGMKSIPLLKSADFNDDTGQKRLDALTPFIDLEDYQRAILRSTELADADLHSGNVALVPTYENRVVEGILKLQTEDLITLLNGTRKGNIENLKNWIKENHLENIFKEISNQNLDEIDEDLLKQHFNDLGKSLSFKVKLFDVDLTMPKNNEIGVTGGKIPARNILLALNLADYPITETVKSEIRQRMENFEELNTFVQEKFSKEEHLAWIERVENIDWILKQKTVTAREVVWRIFPVYGEMEQFFSQIHLIYSKIMKEVKSLPLSEQKSIKNKQLKKVFPNQELKMMASIYSDLQKDGMEFILYENLLGFQNSLDLIVPEMEAWKRNGSFSPLMRPKTYQTSR